MQLTAIRLLWQPSMNNIWRQKKVAYQMLDLKEMPTDIIAPDMYFNRKPSFVQFQQKFLFPTEKYILLIPEYNGGIPGIFKLMMDASDITKAWWGKKAAITGVAAGRAGNARGLDMLTNCLHYLKMQVHYNKIPISRIQELLDRQGNLVDKTTIELIRTQVDQFIDF